MPKLKSRLSMTNSRSAKAMLAVLSATMLSAGSAYANPDQPPTDPSGGTATDSASQPAAGAGTGPVCTRHAEAITSAKDSLTSAKGSLDAIHGAGTSILERQESIKAQLEAADASAQLEAADASDPADIERSQADMERIQAETMANIRDMREMMAQLEQARVDTNKAIARNV